MNLFTVIALNGQPATLDEIRLAAERDGDVLAAAILRTPNPGETIEALYAFACDLEGAYPGCDPRVDLDDLRARAARDHRLGDIVALLESP